MQQGEEDCGASPKGTQGGYGAARARRGEWAGLALVLSVATAAAGCATGWGSRAPWEGPLTPQTQAVEKAVDRAYRHVRSATVAVAYLDLASGGKVLRNETRPFHAASTMKVPLMIAAWAAVDQGSLAIDQPIAVKNDFRSIVDGSHYHLAKEDDGDPELYAAVGGTRPLSDLLRHMIVRSSNLATNLVIEQLSASRVMDVMRQLGAYNLQVLRGVEDEKAFQAGLNNEISAGDLMLLLASLERAAAEPGDAAAAAPPDPGADEPLARPAISHHAAAAMLEVLEAQEFNEKIPAGLPAGTPVAHKTGDITRIHHDAAIVLAPGESPYVLVVLTAGFDKEEEANAFIADLSRGIWQARHAPPPAPKGGKRGRRG